MSTYLTFLGIFVALAIGLNIWREHRKKKTLVDGANADIIAVPFGWSEDRLKQFGLRYEAETDLGILDASKLQLKDRSYVEPEDKNLRAVSKFAWILNVQLPEGFTINKQRYLEVFNEEWRKTFPVQAYAYFPEWGRWSYAVSGDSPEEMEAIEFELELLPRYAKNPPTQGDLKVFLDSLKNKLNKIHPKITVHPNELIPTFANRTKDLWRFAAGLDAEIAIVLSNPQGFDSLAFWDTLVDLGLKWGDGDLFHWQLDEEREGEFSVWTASSPGYFLPELVSKRKFRPESLIFGFNIVRHDDPENLLEIVHAAVKYCQSRLGGSIVNIRGWNYDIGIDQNKIRKAKAHLAERGMEFGDADTLRLF